MANLVPKVAASTWIETARDVLIEEGIDAVKVDRLSKRLSVTRGGFYHHFVDRADLLARLLQLWRETVIFVPETVAPTDPAGALDAIDALIDHLISETHYDPRFDMAVRAWAHSDAAVAAVVDEVNTLRLRALERIFSALGCGAEEASIRARVFYFHQIGYYSIGVKETRETRLAHVDTYIRILCGDANLAAAHRRALSAQRSAVAD